MNYKAFQLKINLQLLVFRDVDSETSNPIVKIYSYYIDDGGYDCMMEENISFENTDSAKSFIRDFSQESAENWCKKNVIPDEE